MSKETVISNPSKWMEGLPSAKWNAPLQSLVIPGSHDSCSFSISKDLEISPAESKWLKALAFLFGKPVKSIVYNWSVTQTLNAYQQLSSGVRYLDLRVALRPKDGLFRVVHGLYGTTLTEIMQQVKQFITECPREIIILDFNHFYNMNQSDHLKFSNSIKSAFGKSMRPPGKQGVTVTLKELWDNHQNILVFYDNQDIVSQNKCFWSDNQVYSPWANTADASTLLKFLNTETESHNLPKDSMHIAQALLSPNTSVLLRHLTSSLKDTLALKATALVTSWLNQIYGDKNHKFNIIIADFIEHDEYISAVVKWNYCN